MFVSSSKIVSGSQNTLFRCWTIPFLCFDPTNYRCKWNITTSITTVTHQFFWATRLYNHHLLKGSLNSLKYFRAPKLSVIIAKKRSQLMEIIWLVFLPFRHISDKECVCYIYTHLLRHQLFRNWDKIRQCVTLVRLWKAFD